MKKYIQARTGREKEVYVTQEYTGYGKTGWEDIAVYDDTSSQTRKEAREEVKSYIDNGYSARMITRRIPNPDYAEPEHGITPDDVINYIENDCLYPVNEYSSSNYAIGKWPNMCQVFIYDDNTVGVFNAYTNRTKTVYTLADMVKSIDKICRG